MTKKPLFDEDDMWTEKASEIDVEIYVALKPIIHKYAEEGYSVRDLAYIVNSTAMDIIVSQAIINRDGV